MALSTTTRCCALVVAGCLALVFSGCGKPASMRVWGQVTWEGKPVEGGSIVFSPVEDTPGPSTGANIVDGKYDVAEKGGPRPAGVYRVEITGVKKTGKKITPPKSEGNQLVDELAPLIPPEYNTRSTLKVTISLDPKQNEIDFNLPVKK